MRVVDCQGNTVQRSNQRILAYKQIGDTLFQVYYDTDLNILKHDTNPTQFEMFGLSTNSLSIDTDHCRLVWIEECAGRCPGGKTCMTVSEGAFFSCSCVGMKRTPKA